MYRKTTLNNGIRVVSHDISDRDSVSLGIFVGVGGRYEQDQVKGAAHFLEHIMFKGSEKYSCDEIKNKIEGVGGALNAFTSEEQTCYYAKIPSKHVKQTLDILADMVFFPKISKKDVVKESTVIVEEIKMYQDLPQYQVLEFLDGLVWPNHPLGKKLAGTLESVTQMTHKQLRNFHATHYSPSNIVIAVCGCLKHDQIVKWVTNKCGKISVFPSESYDVASNIQEKPRFKFYNKSIEQMHMAMGMLGYDENHKDRHALALLSVILGGNMSSRLFVELREKRGLAYSVSTGMKTLHDTGMFMVRAGVDNTKIVETVTLILKEFDKVCKYGVKITEFTRAREYLLGQLLLNLEDTLDHMLWIGDNEISRNKLRTLKKTVQDYEKIKLTDIKRVASNVFHKSRYNLAVIGPSSSKTESSLARLLQI